MPDDAYFGIEPGGKRRIVLTPSFTGKLPANIAVTAMNAEGRFSSRRREAGMNTLHRWFRSGAYSLLGHIDLPESRGVRGVLIVPPFGMGRRVLLSSAALLWEQTCAAERNPGAAFRSSGNWR